MKKNLKIADLIFKNPVLLAPMSGITNPPFKQVCYELGCGGAITEMFSSMFIIKNKDKFLSKNYRAKDEVILWMQIFGSVPEVMAEAASIIENEVKADLIDINMGCPVRKIVNQKSGAYLIKEPELAYKIVKAIKETVSIPVTVKTRKGWDESITSEELITAVFEAGASCVTIHGRSRAAMYSGDSDLEYIARVKQKFNDKVIIANGGIVDFESLKRAFYITGCDGVMIGRGTLGNPWIFKSYEVKCDYKPSLKELKDTVLTHLDYYIEWTGERRAVIEMRKFIGWYFKGYPGVKKIRQNLHLLNTREDVIKLLNSIY